MFRPSSGQSGFSLVEVLCALAIAASAIAVLTGGVGGALKATRSLDQRLGARIILQAILEDELAAAASSPAERQGESGPYRWRLAIAPATFDDKLPQPYRLYRLTATVGWEQGGEISGTVLKLAK